MVTLKDSRDRSHPRTMAVARRETVRTNADGTVSVDADEHVTTLKAAGFKETDKTDKAEGDAETKLDGPTVQSLKDGACPWCDEYDGDHVGRHASSAHTDKWNAYKGAI